MDRTARFTRTARSTVRPLAALAATGTALLAGVGTAHADSDAGGSAEGSPGILSGNTVQAPVNAPVNVCGITVNVVGLLNPTFGNSCTGAGTTASSTPPQTSVEAPPPPVEHAPPAQTPPNAPPPEQARPAAAPPEKAPVTRDLAETGADGAMLIGTIPVAAGALIAGAMLMRRTRRPE